MPRLISVLLKSALLMLAISLTPAIPAYAQKPMSNKTGNTATKPKPTKSTSAGKKPRTKTSAKKPAAAKTSTVKTRDAYTPTDPNLKRTVLFTLGKNEIIPLTEYFSNLKSSGADFVMLVSDTTAGKMSLVRNGNRIATGDWVEVLYIVPDNMQKMAYVTGGSNSSKITINGHTYGPYEKIESWNYNPAAGHSDERFIYKQMNKRFVHEPDGSIFPLEENLDPYSTKGYEMKSKNGNHKLTFAADRHSVSLDGKSIDLMIPSDADKSYIYLTPLAVFDNGKAWIWISYRDAGKAWVNKQYLLSASNLQEIDSNHVLDPITLNIVSESAASANPYGGWNFAHGNYKKKKGVWVAAMDYLLQDPSRRHTFTGSWEYDYVNIDGNNYGVGSPIEAFYDAAANAFVWTALENNQLARYVYNLR